MKKKKNVFPKASKAFLFFHTWLYIILYLRGVIILTTHVDGLVHVAVGCGVLTGPLHVGASASFWGWGIGARAVCAQLVVARARLSADFFLLSFLFFPPESLWASFPTERSSLGRFPDTPTSLAVHAHYPLLWHAHVTTAAEGERNSLRSQESRCVSW